MGIQGTFFATIIYLAAAVFALGFAGKFVSWLAVPNPLKIPTGPAPTTRTGTLLRVASEIIFFRSLSKADAGLWFGGFVFHLSFLIIVLRHLRYFIYPVPEWVVSMSQPGVYAGFALVISIIYLFARRLIIDRIRYVSNFMDYFSLILIVSIGATGLIMKFISRPVLVDIKDFMLSIVHLSASFFPESANWVFILHLVFVLLLLMIFPFSKLMHSGGVFITPTRVMVNNPRTKRHINPWAEEEWNEMVSDAEKNPDSYKPWSVEQWRNKWEQK